MHSCGSILRKECIFLYLPVYFRCPGVHANVYLAKMSPPVYKMEVSVGLEEPQSLPIIWQQQQQMPCKTSELDMLSMPHSDIV